MLRIGHREIHSQEKKMKKGMIAVALLLAAGAARAEERINFDGRGPAALAAGVQGSGAVPEAPGPEQALKARTVAGKVTVDVAVLEGGALREERLVCGRGERGAAVKDCRRAEDGRMITAADIRSLRLEHYFTPRGLTFRALLGEEESAAKSRYCHNPVKECDAWKTEGKKECVEWSDPTPSGYRKCLAMDWVYYDVCAHYSTYCDD